MSVADASTGELTAQEPNEIVDGPHERSRATTSAARANASIHRGLPKRAGRAVPAVRRGFARREETTHGHNRRAFGRFDGRDRRTCARRDPRFDQRASFARS